MGYEDVVPVNERSATRAQVAATIIAIVVGVIALGVAIFALSRTHTTNTHLAGEAAVAALSREVQSLKAELAATQRTATAASAKQQSTISKLTTCIPELSGQITDLSVETSTLTVGEKQFVTGAYLKSGKQVSTYCQSTLESQTQGTGK
jgi:TolA-binding protein